MRPPIQVTPVSGQEEQTAFHSLPPFKRPIPLDGLHSVPRFGRVSRTFKSTSSLRNCYGFWLVPAPANLAAGHPGFLLQTVTRFLRPGFQHYYGFICHLTPLRSVSSLLLSFTIRSGCAGRNDMRLPQLLTGSCEQPHPQSRHGSDQVPGFALFRTLTHPRRRIRFARAVCRSLPIASFRPRRCQRRPCDSDCLPLGRGDACFFQQAGVARFAGQTKKAVSGLGSPTALRSFLLGVSRVSLKQQAYERRRVRRRQ